MLYVINDIGPGQADVAALAERRKDLPPLKNLYQLFGWTTGPHIGRDAAGNWQLLHNVKWVENEGEYIPLVGSASNGLQIFNKFCGTNHILNNSFRNLCCGHRPFGPWTKVPNDKAPPVAALNVADGNSLVGLRRARSRGQARAAVAALNPTPMTADGVGATAPLAGLGGSPEG